MNVSPFFFQFCQFEVCADKNAALFADFPILYTHFPFQLMWRLILLSFFYISASRIRYEITRGNFGGAFAVKNMTGAIYVAGQLDYETRKRVST